MENAEEKRTCDEEFVEEQEIERESENGKAFDWRRKIVGFFVRYG